MRLRHMTVCDATSPESLGQNRTNDVSLAFELCSLCSVSTGFYRFLGYYKIPECTLGTINVGNYLHVAHV